MKDIINVSIAGIAFRLDADAYARLSDYLDRIRAGYGDSPDGREILSDLEARIAELILTAQDAGTVVPLPLIDSALAQLGAPEDISEGRPAYEPKGAGGASTSAGSIPHRLYRNPEGAKLGGVCSGLATYFNVDPALVRLIFAAPLVLMVLFYILHLHGLGRMMVGFMTTAFILYPLLWIVIPKARTPLQRLEMKGEKITRDKIEQTYRAEFDKRGNAPEYIQQRARNARNASVFSEIVSVFGRIVLFFIKVVVAIVGFALFMAVVGILIALLVVAVHGSAGIHGVHFSENLPAALGVVIALLIVLIPLSLAVYGILKFLFGFDHRKRFVQVLGTVWAIVLVFGTVIFIKNFDQIRFDNDFRIGLPRHDEERLAEERESRRVKEEALWAIPATPLTLMADTLFVAPAPGAALPEDFVLNIHHRGDTTRLMLGNRLATETPSVDGSFRNDTLYLHPLADGVSAGFDLNISTQKAVVVAPGINTNEYYER